MPDRNVRGGVFVVAVVAVVVAVREGEGLLPGKGAVFLWQE